MKALTRNTLLAFPLALLFYPMVHDALGAFTFAFSFTFVGHLVEVVLLKIPGIDTPGGRLVRLLGWFAGGLWCYELGRWVWVLYGKDVTGLPPLVVGAFFFVALELVVHAALQARGRPSFFGA